MHCLKADLAESKRERFPALLLSERVRPRGGCVLPVGTFPVNVDVRINKIRTSPTKANGFCRFNTWMVRRQNPPLPQIEFPPMRSESLSDGFLCQAMHRTFPE